MLPFSLSSIVFSGFLHFVVGYITAQVTVIVSMYYLVHFLLEDRLVVGEQLAYVLYEQILKCLLLFHCFITHFICTCIFASEHL